ncbi:juvenile hormone acid O-methyltransferase-like [Argiope bruennichi]|uniref:juvenile hormone acid O-methyltransferase-like n=1 Tax=Argiope bruennichi TaxID=94029 RepID=UPI00249411FA|nr:juvenile hormone acid O-methyltransferase-like [Argiope bruennichi]XP_055945898.1 juvenile hormone acid O-methyltransferase-like [Argiope bruennichi]
MAAVEPQVSYVSTDITGFLEMVISKLGWSDLSDDIVMDVGCGNPKIKLANLLVNFFPNVKQVICIDKNLMMIHYLKISKRPSSIVYQCADIENRSSLIKWEGQIAKVISTHCFHMLHDQRAGFQNVYNLLKPGGEAAILFCVQSGYVGWHCELRDDTKWNKYYNGNAPEIPSTQLTNIDDSYYTAMLEEIGFRIILCEKDRIGVPFESEKAWKDMTFKLALSSFDIPEDLQEEFKKHLFEAFLKHNCRTDNGLPCQSSYFLTALLRKPDVMNN